MSKFLDERTIRRALVIIALGGLLAGLVAWFLDRSELARWSWAAGTVPVVLALLFSMLCDFLAGRVGVDAIAFVSMSAALVLGQALVGAHD